SLSALKLATSPALAEALPQQRSPAKRPITGNLNASPVPATRSAALPSCFRNCSKRCLCVIVREVKDERFGGQCNDRRILAALHHHERWPRAKKLYAVGLSTGSNRLVSQSRDEA